MNDVTSAPPRAEVRGVSLRSLLALAWPIVVSRSAQVVVGLADATMVAHLGEVALAATANGAMNAWALFILPMGVVFIVASFASQLTGRGDPAAARRYGWYGLAVAAATQLGAMAAFPLVGPALGLFEYAPDVHAEMTGYVRVRLWSTGAVVGLEALGNYYGGLGNTRLPMRAQLLAMVANVAGNWLLIDGRLGLPAMGVRGAALASALATGLAFAALVAVFLRDGRRAGAILPRLHAHELVRMLRFGFPSGVNWFLEFAAFLFFVNVVVAGLGTTSLAAFSAVLQVNSMSFMPAFALASAGAILVGQAIGAGHRGEVPRVVGITFAAAAVWECAVGVAYVALPTLLFSPFARGPDPEAAAALLEAGARMLALSAAWQLFDAAAAALGECLRGAGDTVFPMWARIALAWALFVPGSWVSVRHLGGGDLVAVAWVVAYIAVLAIVLWLRFRSGAWRRIELIEPVVA